MPRRKFVAKEVKTETVVVPKGTYAATFTAKIMGKNGSLISIVPKETWEKGERITHEGEFMLRGSLLLELILTSEKAIAILQRDAPYVNSFMRLSFREGEGEQEGIMELVETPAFGQLLHLLDLQDVDLEAEMDFEHDDDIAIPQELEGFEGAVQLLNDKAYYEALFSAICNYAVSVPVVASLHDTVQWGDRKGKPENSINIDSESLGLAPYHDGDELDKED